MKILICVLLLTYSHNVLASGCGHQSTLEGEYVDTVRTTPVESHIIEYSTGNLKLSLSPSWRGIVFNRSYWSNESMSEAIAKMQLGLPFKAYHTLRNILYTYSDDCDGSGLREFTGQHVLELQFTSGASYYFYYPSEKQTLEGGLTLPVLSPYY